MRHIGIILFFGLSLALSLRASNVENELKAKYAYLFDEKIKTLPDGSAQFHKARLFIRNGINVLFLHGDEVEMAFQHGVLLKEQISQGAVVQTARLVENLANNQFGKDTFLAKLLPQLVDKFIAQGMNRYTRSKNLEVAKKYENIIYALSWATGIDSDTILRAALAPDTYMVLAKLSVDLGGMPTQKSDFANACTTVTAWDDFTPKGEMILGRNLDFPLNGYFDRFPTVVYFDPTDGGQKYLSFSSAGVHNAGITGMNESGIYIAAHTIPTTEASSRGIPPFMTMTEALKHDTTLDEVVSRMSKSLPPSGWAFDVVSLKEKRVVTVEWSNSAIGVRESKNGFHVQTNQFQTPDMKDTNLYVNHSIDEDSQARHKRALELLFENKGQVTASRVAAILSDQVDPFSGKTKSVGNTIGVHTTVGSVVIDAKQRKAYVATGMAPVSHNAYLALPFPGDWDGDSFSVYESSEIAPTQFATESPQLAHAMQVFILAKKSWEFESDVAKATSFLKQCRVLEPANPTFDFLHGIFLLKSNQFEDAKSIFKLMLESDYRDHQKNLARYYLGRIAAHNGDLAVALDYFSEITSNAYSDRKLKAAAGKFLSAVKTWGKQRLDPASLHPYMQDGDMESY